MASTYLLLPIMISFFISLWLMPSWIRKVRKVGLVWEDMNKYDKRPVAGSGGIIVVFAFVIGVLVFVAYRTFILETNVAMIEIFAILSVVLMLAGIGLIDDLFGWRQGGLRKKYRMILVALASIPLMAINAGRSEMILPFLGSTDLGLLYPLILIPLGIVGATTTFNFLAGFNGLEAGLGILLMGSLGIVAHMTGSPWLAIIAFCMAAALLGFLRYNKFPAKVFPGDSITYAIGGMIAMIAIVGNFEKIAVFFFIPYILEVFLKSRGRLVKQSFGKPNEYGELGLRYNKIYSLNHLAILMMKKMDIIPTEKKVVYSIWAFQLVIILIGFLIFGEAIF